MVLGAYDADDADDAGKGAAGDGSDGVISSDSQSSERPLRYGLEDYTNEKGHPGRRSMRNKGKAVKYLF